MYKKITRPQLKKMLKEGSPVEVSLCKKGKDINHPYICTHMDVKVDSIERLDKVISTSYSKSFGTNEPPQLCIWIEEDEE